MGWERIQRIHGAVRKKAWAIMIALAAAIYRAAQEIGYAPKEIYFFPILVYIFALFVLYLIVTSDSFTKTINRFHEKMGEDRRVAAYIIVISIGSILGGALAAGGYRVFEYHKAHMKLLSLNELDKESSKGPRLGIGSDAYKDLTDEQVGQWAIEEAEKIEEMASMKNQFPGNINPRAQVWFFSNDFKKCCAQDVKDLRTEILRRLGPPGKDPKEESAWEFLFPTVVFPGHPNEINPMAVKEYSRYLKMLGRKLKRRSNPRVEPYDLKFTEQRIAPEKDAFPYRLLITIETNTEIKNGYITVKFIGEPIIEGTDFEGTSFLLPNDVIDNELLEEFLNKAPYPKSFVFQIGKVPFKPTKPIHVVAFYDKPFKVERVILFDL